jgi:hypothetical protein
MISFSCSIPYEGESIITLKASLTDTNNQPIPNQKCYIFAYDGSDGEDFSTYQKSSNENGIIEFKMFVPIQTASLNLKESGEFLPVSIGNLNRADFINNVVWDLGNITLFKSDEIIPFTLFLNAISTNKIIEIIEVNAIKYESRIKFFNDEFYYETQMNYQLKKNQNFEVFYQVKNLNTNEIETFTIQLAIEEDPIEYTITY